jgi:hypothetical protein
LAPLVALGAAAVMWINSWVYEYQLMFCYVSKIEHQEKRPGLKMINPE